VPGCGAGAASFVRCMKHVCLSFRQTTSTVVHVYRFIQF